MRHGTRRNVPRHGLRDLPRQEHADLVIGMSRKKLPQIFAGIAVFLKISQLALDGIRHFRRGAAVAHGASDRGILAHRATHAEVVSVHHLAAHFDFLTFQADVRNPMLAAAVRQPATCSFSCSSNPGMRSSSSSTSQRAKLFVSVSRHLQNSEPVQAIVPRAKAKRPPAGPLPPVPVPRRAACSLGTFDKHQVLHNCACESRRRRSVRQVRGRSAIDRR